MIHQLTINHRLLSWLTQPDLELKQQKNEIDQPKEVPNQDRSCFKLESLLLYKLIYIGGISIKKFMMQGIKATLAKAFELDYQVENT